MAERLYNLPKAPWHRYAHRHAQKHFICSIRFQIPSEPQALPQSLPAGNLVPRMAPGTHRALCGCLSSHSRLPTPWPTQPHLQEGTRCPVNLFGSSQPSSSSKTKNAPSPAYRWRPNGVSQVHLLKGKGTHHLQAERNQRHFYLQGKKVSGSDVLRSGADNQEARVDPLKKKLIFHTKPKPDTSTNLQFRSRPTQMCADLFDFEIRLPPFYGSK